MSKDDHEDCCDEDDDDTDNLTEENQCYQVLHRLRGHPGKKYGNMGEIYFLVSRASPWNAGWQQAA